jgi:hypothetical protein
VKGEVMTWGTSGASSYIGFLDTNFPGNTYSTSLGFLNNESYIASRYITYGYRSKADLSNTYLEFKHGNSDGSGGGISRGLDGANTDIYRLDNPTKEERQLMFINSNINTLNNEKQNWKVCELRW